MTALLTAAVSAIAVLAAALVTAFVGPAWKIRHDRRRQAEEIVGRYSRPLMQAAYELQSRIYNIARLRFFARGSLLDAYRRSYAETSTLWLIGQYLGWVEILRREVQFLDLGDLAKTRLLRDRLLLMLVRVPDVPDVTRMPLTVSLPLVAAAAGKAVAATVSALPPARSARVKSDFIVPFRRRRSR
jgi:hypothetical protein